MQENDAIIIIQPRGDRVQAGRPDLQQYASTSLFWPRLWILPPSPAKTSWQNVVTVLQHTQPQDVKTGFTNVLRSRRCSLLRKALCLQNSSHRELKHLYWFPGEKRQNSKNTKFPFALVNEFRKTKETSFVLQMLTESLSDARLYQLFQSIS